MDKEFNTVFKNILLKTMKAFDAFCKQYNIEYVAAYGTVIGAIRHKGLIPWDDDIDVFMDWTNYNKFLSLRSEAKLMGYCIVDRHNKGYYLPMAKFTDTKSTIWEHKKYPFVYGVYIDVFPLGFAKDLSLAKELHSNYVTHSIMMTKAYTKYDMSCMDIKHIIGHPVDVAKDFYARFILEKEQAIIDDFDEQILSIYDGDYRIYYRSMAKFENSLFKSEWFKKSILVPFEDFEIPVPIGYDEYLTTVYGDYLTPPPVEKQISHHSHYYCNLRERLTLEQVKERISKGEHLVY